MRPVGLWRDVDCAAFTLPLDPVSAARLCRRTSRKRSRLLAYRGAARDSACPLVAEHFAQSTGPPAQRRPAVQGSRRLNGRPLPPDEVTMRLHGKSQRTITARMRRLIILLHCFVFVL